MELTYNGLLLTTAIGQVAAPVSAAPSCCGMIVTGTTGDSWLVLAMPALYGADGCDIGSGIH